MWCRVVSLVCSAHDVYVVYLFTTSIVSVA